MKFVNKEGKEIESEKLGEVFIKGMADPTREQLLAKPPYEALRDFEDVLLELYVDRFVQPAPEWMDMSCETLGAKLSSENWEKNRDKHLKKETNLLIEKKKRASEISSEDELSDLTEIDPADEIVK